MATGAPQRHHDTREAFNALRWVVERSFTWAARFHRLVKDYERLLQTVEGLHYLIFAGLMLKACFAFIQSV